MGSTLGPLNVGNSNIRIQQSFFGQKPPTKNCSKQQQKSPPTFVESREVRRLSEPSSASSRSPSGTSRIQKRNPDQVLAFGLFGPSFDIEGDLPEGTQTLEGSYSRAPDSGL